MSGEVQRSQGRFPVVGDVSESPAAATELHPGHVLGRQLKLAQQRAAWLGDRLAEQIEAEGVGGVVGDQLAATADGGAVRVSEFARVLGELERAERATAARLAREIAQLGIENSAVTSAGREVIPVSTGVAWMAELAEQLGHPWADVETKRTAQRAVLRVRERQEAAQ